MTNELLALGATDMLERYASGDLSPVEVARAVLDQIERLNPTVNAFCHLDPDFTLSAARESEARWRRGESRGALDGVPVAVKDVFLTPMWPTLKGSRTVDPQTTLGQHAPATAALERNGYVPVGKTTTPEFGWKGVTDCPLHGVTVNPWDTTRTAGGSSGGSAVAVALGMAPLALGTDAGGSIRIPAGFCGLVGLKPSRGEVPHWPPPPYGELAHAGPMAWTVRDCALLMNVLTEGDPRDVNAAPRRGIDYLQALEHGVKGLRVGYSASLGYVDVTPEIEAAVERAAGIFEAMGAHVVAVDPSFSDPLSAFNHLFYSGTAAVVHKLSNRKREVLDPELRKVAERAAQLTMLDYLSAVAERNALSERMARFHLRYDLLLTPALPLTAFDAGREVPVDWPSTRWPTWTPFTYPFNMTGQPALAVPCGFAGDGMPISLQLVGRRYEDALVLRAGHAWQQAEPLTAHRPSLFHSDPAALEA